MKTRKPTGLLLCWLVLVSAAHCLAQSSPAQNAQLNKKACDYLSKTEAEAILGAPVELERDNPFECMFGPVGPISRDGDKVVRLSVWFWTSPQVNQYADTKEGIPVTYRFNPPVVTDVPDLGDAAMWVSVRGSGALWAFKGGTIQVEVAIAGLPDAEALRSAKAIAAKAMGGAAGTGFAYRGTPKANTAASAVEDAQTATLIRQGKSYSQAPRITQSQFLKSVKEVSLTLRPASSLTKYIPAAEQRSTIERELTKYGVAVRPNAQVSLLATIEHEVSAFTRTVTQGGSTNKTTYPIHGLGVELKFFVRAAAWRSGKFHLIAASPAWGSAAGTVYEYNETQKAVFRDDPTAKDLRAELTSGVETALKSMASTTDVDPTPWPVTSWTAREKAAADAEFLKIMSPQTAIEKRQVDGLTAAPKLNLAPTIKSQDCAADSSWSGLWERAFQRVGLVEKPGTPTLWLSHHYDCYVTDPVSPVHIYRLTDWISLVETDLVFELNGSFVRKSGEILSGGSSQYGLKEDAAPPTKNGYFSRSIGDFLIDLATGNANAPPIAAPRPRQ
jgi:hypothetical protein